MASRTKKHGKSANHVRIAEPAKRVETPSEKFEEDALNEDPVPETVAQIVRGPKPVANGKHRKENPEPKPEPAVVVPREDNIDTEEELAEGDEVKPAPGEEVDVEEIKPDAEEAEEEAEEEEAEEEEPEVEEAKPEVEVKPEAEVKPVEEAKPAPPAELEEVEDDDKPLIPKPPALKAFYDKYTRKSFGFDIVIACAEGKTLYFNSYCMHQYAHFKSWFNRDEFDGTHLDLSAHPAEAVGAVLRFMDPYVATNAPGLIELRDVSDDFKVSRAIINMAAKWEGFRAALHACYVVVSVSPTVADLAVLKEYDIDIYSRAVMRVLDSGDISTASWEKLFELIASLKEYNVLYDERIGVLMRLLKALSVYGKTMSREEAWLILGHLREDHASDVLAAVYILAGDKVFTRHAIEFVSSIAGSDSLKDLPERLDTFAK